MTEPTHPHDKLANNVHALLEQLTASMRRVRLSLEHLSPKAVEVLLEHDERSRAKELANGLAGEAYPLLAELRRLGLYTPTR